MTRRGISWEDNYVGVWIGAPSRELRIRKTSPRRFLATLLINGRPIERPWMSGEPTVDMPATYSFTATDGSEFSVDLWTDERFVIGLNYEPDFPIHDDSPCEALTMGITRGAEFDFLEQYYGLLGGLGHFVRGGGSEA